MSEVDDQIAELVNQVREEKPFNVLDAIRGVKYPVGKVRVYLDGELATELEELYGEKRLEEAEGALASAELNEILSKIADVEAEIRGSALTFHLRGVPPKVKRIIIKEAARKFKVEKGDDDAAVAEKLEKQNTYITYELMRHSIVKTENASGGVDTHGWTYEEVEELDNTLIESEFSKLDELCAKLTQGSRVFNETLDADFLSNA